MEISLNTVEKVKKGLPILYGYHSDSKFAIGGVPTRKTLF